MKKNYILILLGIILFLIDYFFGDDLPKTLRIIWGVFLVICGIFIIIKISNEPKK